MAKARGDEIIGQLVKVVRCIAIRHGDDSICVCDLIGKTVTISRKKHKTIFVGTYYYGIMGSNKRVVRCEVVLPRKKRK